MNNTTDRSHASSSVSKTQITPSSSPTKKNQNHNNLPELSKLTGNYCDLIQSIDSTCVSRKPSETNRTLYVSIDSVATVAASKVIINHIQHLALHRLSCQKSDRHA